MLFRDIAYVNSKYEVEEHVNILVSGNTINSISPNLIADYAGPVIDGKNKLAMPGFFNIHSHVPMTLLRGFGEGLPLDKWLFERMFPFEALLTGDDIYWGSLLGIAEMLSSGCVSFTDMYMQVPNICKAVDESGIKANLSHGASGLGEGTHFKDVGGWQGLQDLLSYTKTASHDRIIADASIHAEYTTDALLCREVLETAQEHGMRLQVHLSETRKEHEECKQRRDGLSPAAWFNSLGVFDVPTTAAHCVWIQESDFPILKSKGVTVAHCPSSNLKLGSGIAPVSKMLKQGLRVGIGTDGAASNNNINCLEEVTLASMLQKGTTGNALAMGCAETLQMASLTGAQSQGRLDCGVLQVGSRADIVLYDLDLPALQPRLDILSNILYAAPSNAVCMTMVDGKILYQDGEYTGIDIERVKHEVNRIATQTAKELGL